jgi:methylmalonyl-CoA mutase N-terminal domain/subunit
VNESLGAVRRQQIAAVRAARNQSAVDQSLQALSAAASGTQNLMPFILATVKAEATVGEICDTLRAVFGEYQERLVL